MCVLIFGFCVSGVITICIANFNIFGDNKLKTEYKFLDNKDFACKIEKLKIITLQLPKVPDKYSDCDNELKKWLFLLIKMTTMEYYIRRE